jgi:glycine/D-amino acid oxidase-like deaminating enzyme/nitrite reductase/ring-hydroxylating ferredoxin subunit
MIARDGVLTSLWQESGNEYQTSHKPTRTHYEVAIAGGGITGITTALMLQKSGKRCILFEANNLCFGTTGGTTAHLNTILDTHYSTLIKNFGKEGACAVAQSTVDAIQSIKSFIREYHIECGFEEASGYIFARDSKQAKELDEIYESYQEVGLNPRVSDSLPISSDFKKAMVVEGQAKFSPIPYVHALAHAFEEAGGVIVQDCRVQKIDEQEKLVYVETEKGTFIAFHFIYATHIPSGINVLHLRCAPYRSYAIAARLKDNSYPKDLCYDLDDPYHYYRTQNVNGVDYLVAGGEDHKTGHKTNTDQCFRALESHLLKYFNIDSFTHHWSSQYFEPADGLPYIGHMPGHSGKVLVATGFGGNGMIFSNVAARVLSSYIVVGKHVYGDIFSPTRVKPMASFSKMIEHNSDVLKQFVGKWFSSVDHAEIADLAPGEAKILKLDGHTMGLYKDEQGGLHAVNPTCTHMKCIVSWNGAERSWDCPCHGTRFSAEGKVLTGPADFHLEVLPLSSLISSDKKN